MDDLCTYRIQLRGQVDLDEVNAKSPLELAVERADSAGTLLSVRTDQSGLIGLMRHLHGQGWVLLGVEREGSMLQYDH